MEQNRAKGASGFLIFDHALRQFVFRVYESADKSQFVDYDLAVDDLAITITDDYYSLFTHKDEAWVGYTDINEKIHVGSGEKPPRPSLETG